MPRRDDISTILVIGSGPIVIGQACEFDYSGAQACKVLREDGYRVVLGDSKPATIMTDPEFADRTYIEPVTPEFVAKVIAVEPPDALLPTLGGQTGLNCAVALAESGVLDEYGVELVGGAELDVIKKGEDRRLFSEAMAAIGLEVPRGAYGYSVPEAEAFAARVGFPVVVRPSFTMGGAGGGIAYNVDELRDIAAHGIALSPIGEVLVEESVIGWKEYEMEVMRDVNDNAVIVCSIENVDAMGVHTGDSITVAPAQTLSDREYQAMRDASLAILREIGVETGGSNVQFAVDPRDGRMLVIEMNPRVSRSSALASKATGFPIAKIAAKLAVGYTLDEISNDITKVTPACFEPSIDYTVVKVPRWAFEKFKGTDTTLTTRMKSVGEAMAIGRTFAEALGKAFRSLENGRFGLGADGKDLFDEVKFDNGMTRPNENRMFYIADALWRGRPVDEVAGLTHIDPWFLDRIKEIVEVEGMVREAPLHEMSGELMRLAKQHGLSDPQLAYLTGTDEASVRSRRLELGVKATFKSVDTCAGEFEASTPYYYKTYEDEDEVTVADRPRIVILGAGPNRIGQGIEFDYCCVHASYALHDAGYETVMVNCNPETVSTDYDTSDRLYFEPLTFEDVMDICDAESPTGVLVTFGGQTPLKLARALEEAGVPILGTKPEAIDLAEDRERFADVLDRLGIPYPAAGTARSAAEAIEVAGRIGYPLLVRPSYVLGGRGMVIAYNEEYLLRQFADAVVVSPDHPVLLDRFLEGAIEVDVDAVCDQREVYIGGVMEHIEEAGIHSGDSACCIPHFTLSDSVVDRIREHTRRIALEIGTHGLINIQFAVKDSTVYVLEVNPRASRTVPFVSKATGVPLAKVAARVMAGEMLADLALPDEERELGRFCVKEAVMPFGRFPGADSVLGPEMKSTGEVMGSASDFPAAYAKSQLAIEYSLPEKGGAFISVCDGDKRAIVGVARHLHLLGFQLLSTHGTARALRSAGLPVTEVLKVHEGRPNIVDSMANDEVQIVINTPMGRETRADGYQIRAAAIRHGVANITTIEAAQAAVQAIEAIKEGRLVVTALQDFPQWRPPGVPDPEAEGTLVTCEIEGHPSLLEHADVVSNDRVAPGVGLIVLRAPRIAATVRPGQFVHLRIATGADFILRRPFSVHRAGGETIALLYQVLGRGTRRLAAAERGGRMDAIGPLGHGWEIDESVTHALLVAGGLGAAPLGMLAEQLAERGAAVSVAQGAPTAERLVARGLFERVARRYEAATDDGSAGEQGLVTAVSERLLGEDRPDVVCACGPEAMSRTVAAQAESAGVPCLVSLERLMACGIGACLSCVVTTSRGRLRACVDGPVFDAGEVCWDGSEVPPRH